MEKEAQWGAFQLEKGEKGTPHVQGVVGYKNQRSFASMCTSLPKAHVEPCKNATASWDYCQKEEGRLEGPLTFGVPPARRNVKGDVKKRNALLMEKGAAQAVLDGDIRIEQFFAVDRAIAAVKSRTQPLDTMDGPLRNLWLYGPPGTGKSRWARKEFPGAYLKDNSMWWDHYAGEEDVIIDELGPQQVGP